MKNITSLYLVFCTCISLNAQVDLDSLWNIWYDTAIDDSTRFEVMYKICDSRARSQPDSIFVWSEELYQQAKIQGSKKHQAGALLQKGRAFSYKGDYSNASVSYDQSLAFYEEVNYKFGIGRVLAYMAGNLANQGDYGAAIKASERTMGIAQEINNLKLSSGAAMVLGQSYHLLGNTVKAIEVFEQGRMESEQIGDEEALAWHLHSIADVYGALGEEEREEEYHQQSLKIYVKIDDKLGIANIVNHQATNSLEKGDLQSAMNGFKRSERIYLDMGAKDPLTGILLGLANVRIELGDHIQASNYINRAEVIAEDMGYADRKSEILIAKGFMGQIQKDHTKAIKWCQEAYNIAKALGILRMQREACNCLYLSYKALKDSDNALLFHEEISALEDSLHSDVIGKKMQQVEFSKVMLKDSLQEVEERFKLQLAHEAEVHKKNKTQNTLLGTGFLMLLLAGGLWGRLRFTRKAKMAIEHEKERSENLLLNILPAEVAAELKAHGKAAARDFEKVSILFTDFKSFTETSEKLSATELVSELNYCFEGFDRIMKKHGIEKIKTIGDAYMAAGGLLVASEVSTKQTVKAAIEMQRFIKERKVEQDKKGIPAFEMRAGIHTGPVVAGIVGLTKFQYDIWGDTVNTASRLESASKIGKVNISQITYELIKYDPEFRFESRGKIRVKGKGELDMYFVKLRT